MVRFVILDSSAEQGAALKKIIQDSFSTESSVEVVDSPTSLYRTCLQEPADLVFASPSPSAQEEEEREDSFHQVLDGLHRKFPWIQILLLLEENLESIRVLRRRDERFLFRPYQKSSVEHIIQESLNLEKVIRFPLAEKSQPSSQNQKLPAESDRFLSLVESHENTSALRRELEQTGQLFGWGFTAVVEEGKTPGSMERVHEQFRRKGWRVFERDSEEGHLVLIIAPRIPSSGLNWQKQVILNHYTSVYISVYGPGITESLSQLDVLLTEARKKSVNQERYTPLAWTLREDLESIASSWALTVTLSNLTGRRDDILALNRHQASQLAQMTFRDQIAALQIARLTLEGWMNRLYDLKQEKLELSRIPDEENLMDEKTLFSWLLLWSDQAFMMADIYSFQSHIQYLTRIYQTILHRFRDKEFSLENLSGQLGLSAGYICSLMKKYTPYSFVDYLSQCRVYYAMALLDTDLLIKNVASEAGFQSSTYLGRVFKAIMGITPGEYRRTLQKKRFENERQKHLPVSG